MPDTLIPIRQYADTAANLAAVNPVPLARQLVIESDKGRAKLGDGVTAYNSLPYVFGAPGTGISGTAATYAGLPAPGSASGEFWAVIGSQGTSWLPGPLGGTYYSAGVYYSNGASWTYVGSAPYQASQADVDAGVINNQFVTPATFASASKWSTKQDNITLTTSGTSGAATFSGGTLNIPQYQGAVTLTTTGTSGASTLSGSTLNIPQYQAALTLTTTGTSGAATLAAGTLNIPQYQAALTNPVTGTGANGQVTFWTGTNTQSGSTNFVWNESKKAILLGDTSGSPTSLNSSNIVTGNWFSIYASLTNNGAFFREILSYKTSAYVFDSGADYTPIIFRQQSGESIRIAATTKNVGIANSAPSARLTVRGSGLTSASLALLIENYSASAKLAVKDDGSVEIGKNDSGTTQSTASITVTSGDSRTGLALITKGNGAITAGIPDGTATGGNARGLAAVDLQIYSPRFYATDVASGDYAVISGGLYNRASGARSVVSGGSGNNATALNSAVSGGSGNTASGDYSFAVGQSNTASNTGAFAVGTSCVASGLQSFAGGTFGTASGWRSFAFGQDCVASAHYSVANGYSGKSYLYAQRAISNSSAVISQTSDIRLTAVITGTAKSELFLDGTSLKAILPANNRLWNAKAQIAAICTTQGNGTVTAGESFIGNYAVGISRIGTTTSLIGTVQNLHTPQTSTNMADAVVDITADDTNEALKIEFTPPTTAGSTTVIRVVATVYLTEVGY